MKVVFVTTWNTACGIATYSANLIEQLEAIGVKIEIFSDTNNFNKLVKLCKDTDADVVHFQHEFGISVTEEAFLSLLGKLQSRNIATVVTTHTEDDLNNILLDGVASAIILHSDPRKLHKREGTFSPFYNIPHGIPEIKLSEEKSFYRKKYGIPEDAFVIGTCGFLSSTRAQQIENLVVAMADFIGKHKDIYIHTVTSAHRVDTDGNMARAMESAILKVAEKHGFADRIQIGTAFTPTEEFRERIFTLDVGFAYCSPETISNSGAAADIISCGVPMVINESPHFSHIREYCVPTEDNGDMSKIACAIESLHCDLSFYSEMEAGAEDAITNLGYSKIAKLHADIYNKISKVHDVEVKVPSKHKPLNQSKTINITMPNSIWQILVLWTKMQPLVDAGHRIKLTVQHDNLTESSTLKYVLDGLVDVEYADIGLREDDKRLVRLHSHSLSQNMTTDINDWLMKGNNLDQLFGDCIGTAPHINCGEYAVKRSFKILPADLNNSTSIVNVTEEMVNILQAGGITHILGTKVLFVAAPKYGYLLDEVEAIAKEQLSGGYKILVEDMRTRWALAHRIRTLAEEHPSSIYQVYTEYDDMGVYCALKGVPHVHIATDEMSPHKLNEFSKLNNTKIYATEGVNG